MTPNIYDNNHLLYLDNLHITAQMQYLKPKTSDNLLETNNSY